MEKKAVFVIIVCCLLVHLTVIGSDLILYHTASTLSMMEFLNVDQKEYL